MQSLHACPKGVQALHALQTGVQALHACTPARHVHAYCRRAHGVRHAGEGVQGLARLKRKACSPRTPFSLGIRGGVRTPFGRAAIKPPEYRTIKRIITNPTPGTGLVLPSCYAKNWYTVVGYENNYK